MTHVPRVHSIAAVVLLAFAAPALAFPDPTTPLLDVVTHDGPGWARFDVTSDGATLEAYVTANLTADEATVGVLLRAVGGGGFMLTLVNGEAGPFVRVESNALPEGVFVEPAPTSVSGMSGAGIIVTGWRGALTVVAFSAGNVGDTHATLFGAVGNLVTSSSSGVKTFMGTEGDFAGPVNAQANAGLVKPGAVVGDFSVEVGGTLVGQFFSIGETNLVGVTTQRTTMTTPAGDRTCGCFWMDPDAAMSTGTYTFHLTYVSATFISNVFLAGADLSG